MPKPPNSQAITFCKTPVASMTKYDIVLFESGRYIAYLQVALSRLLVEATVCTLGQFWYIMYQ